MRKLDHVYLPCCMRSQRIPRKNLCKVGGVTLLELAINRFTSWFPEAVITVGTTDAEASAIARNCGCEVTALESASGGVVELFNHFLEHKHPSERCLCYHLTSPFVFRSELVQAINDPRPFVGSAVMPFRLDVLTPGTLADFTLTQERPYAVMRVGSFLVANGSVWATATDHGREFTPMSWLSAIDIDDPEDLHLADVIAGRMGLEAFESLDLLPLA